MSTLDLSSSFWQRILLLACMTFGALSLTACDPPPEVKDGSCKNSDDCVGEGTEGSDKPACCHGQCQECCLDPDCKPGYKCEKNRCVQDQCATDADCPSPQVCRDGDCVPECNTDPDCNDPNKVCRGQRCVPKPECETDGECGEDQECRNEKCVAKPPPPEPKCELTRVFFGFDLASIDDDARAMLEANAECMRKRPELSVSLAGHADERGTSEYNYALGQRRAESVKRFLKNVGIDASRITTVSFGEDRPLASGTTEEDYARNRRVDFEAR